MPNIGDLNEILVLRGFDDDAALNAERRRTLLSANPFGCAEFLTHLQMHSYGALSLDGAGGARRARPHL